MTGPPLDKTNSSIPEQPRKWVSPSCGKITRNGDATPLMSQSFVTVGLEKKVSPISTKVWSDLSLTLHGRDKITKILQYLARLLAWWLKAGRKSTSVRLSALSKSLSTSRKAFRLGRSLLEIEKLQKLGLGRLILWHLMKASPSVPDDTRIQSTEKSPFPTAGPTTLNKSPQPTKLWQSVLAGIKVFGMLGFFAGDNIAFLSSSGVLDNHSVPSDAVRLKRRRKLQDLANIRANQSYFVVSLVGLALNANAYAEVRRSMLDPSNMSTRNDDDSSRNEQDALQRRQQEKQFSRLMALIKVSRLRFTCLLVLFLPYLILFFS